MYHSACASKTSRNFHLINIINNVKGDSSLILMSKEIYPPDRVAFIDIDVLNILNLRGIILYKHSNIKYNSTGNEDC